MLFFSPLPANLLKGTTSISVCLLDLPLRSNNEQWLCDLDGPLPGGPYTERWTMRTFSGSFLLIKLGVGVGLLKTLGLCDSLQAGKPSLTAYHVTGY